MTLIAALATAFISQAAQASVEVPFRMGEDAIIVDAIINSRKVSLMFDTGFSGAVVLESGLNIGEPTGKVRLRDFVGEFLADTTKIKSLKLGQKSIDPTDMEAVMAGGRDYSFAYNTHCDGIMGFEVIQNNVTQINFESKKFVFFPKSYDITKLVPDNKKTFMAKLIPAGHGSLEMEVMTGDGKKLILALDTGNAFYATTHKDVLERVGLWTVGKDAKFPRASMVASGEVSSWNKRMQNMTIFGVPVPESVWDIIDLPSSSAEGDGTVGIRFLRNFNITFDYERRRVWLENFTGKVGNEPIGDIGVLAFPDPSSKRLTIFRVSPGSPAEKAGVKRFDQVLSIDGNEQLDLGPRALMKLFEGPKGSKCQLAISRGGNLMRFEIERDFMVNE